MGVPPNMDLFALMNTMRQYMPTGTIGGSDELNRAWLQAQAQQNEAALQSATQAALQQQTNQLRMAELMGAQTGGAPTDAATRWRSELAAQQAVQDKRLQQEYAQLMGVGVGGAQTLAGQAQTADIARQNAALYGAGAGGQTLEAQRLAQEAREALYARQQQTGILGQQQTFQGQESAAERALREKLQAGQITSTEKEGQAERDLKAALASNQLTQQEKEFARTHGLAALEQQRRQQELAGVLDNGQLTEAARAARAGEAAKMAELSGQVAGGGLTEQSRAARTQEQTQRASLAAQLLSTPKDVFKAGAYFRTLGAGNQGALGMGSGGISGFNTLGGRMGGTGGTISLADMDAQLGAGGAVSGAPGYAAQQSMTGANTLAGAGTPAGGEAGMPQMPTGGMPSGTAGPAVLGATGGGATDAMERMIDDPGFNQNAAAQRGMARVTPGGEMLWNTAEEQAQVKASQDPANYTNGVYSGPGSTSTKAGSPLLGSTMGAADLQGGTGGGGGGEADGTLAAQGGGGGGSTPSFGQEPGGPVGGDAASLVASGLGDLGLGIGAGGAFQGRQPPAAPLLPSPSVAGAPAPMPAAMSMPTPGTGQPIPYVDPSVLEDPDVKQMFSEMRKMGRRDSAVANRMNRSGGGRPSGPGGPQDSVDRGPHLFGERTARGRAAADERYLRGLTRLNLRGALPGAGPAGPVGAPLWPTGDAATATMPALEESSSLGAGSFAAAPAPSAGISSVGDAQQAQALSEMQMKMLLGPGSMGPQELQRMSGTQRGVAEGAVGALGGNWEDFEDAYAQTRFQNTGNALSA